MYIFLHMKRVLNTTHVLKYINDVNRVTERKEMH